jgi:hypothetical protein
MPGRKRREQAADLSRAAVRFEQWRQRRVRGTRIPVTLWSTAVKLAGRHGVSRVAMALKLDYYALQRRLAQRRLSAVNIEAPNASPAFVELAASAGLSCGQCLIEFSDGSGATLRVHLPTGQVPDVVALGRHFWDVR